MGAHKLSGLIDEEGHKDIKAYQTRNGVTGEEAVSVALKMGAGRMASLHTYAEKKRKERDATGKGRAPKAAKPKAVKAAAKPKAKAAAKAKPVKAAAKPKAAAKAKGAPKASAKPKAAAASAAPKKAAAASDKPKRSPLVAAAAKKPSGVSRIAPHKPPPAAGVINGAPVPVTTSEVAEA